MKKDNREPFIAPSADGEAMNRKKVRAGMGLAKVMLAAALFMLAIWAIIGGQSVYHSLFGARCIQTDSCV